MYPRGSQPRGSPGKIKRRTACSCDMASGEETQPQPNPSLALYRFGEIPSSRLNIVENAATLS
jgi:hypothetical protein